MSTPSHNDNLKQDLNGTGKPASPWDEMNSPLKSKDQPNGKEYSKSEFTTIAQNLRTNVQAEQIGNINIYGEKEDERSPFVQILAYMMGHKGLSAQIAAWASVVLLTASSVTLTYGWQVEGWFNNADNETYLAWIAKGDSLMAEQAYEEARAAYANALKYNTTDSAAIKKIDLIDKASRYVEMGDYEHAQETFELVLTIDPGLEMEVGLESEESLAEKNSEDIANKMQVRIKRLAGGLIEIRVTGGRPFPDPSKPYEITGLTDQPEKIEWRKEGDTYVALLYNMKNASILSIQIKDSEGAEQEGKLPAITSAELFSDQKTIADDWFNKQEYSRAKAEYEKALGFKAKDAYCLGQIKKCDKNIEALKAQNPEMVHVTGGAFAMGTDQGELDEGPVHQVLLEDFYISKFEVTVEQYRSFCQATGRQMPSAPTWGWKDEHPIVNVSWEDAQAFCHWAGGRLPTEAEWEYAARGGNKSNSFSYSGSNEAAEVAWYRDNSSSNTTHPVGNRPVFNEIGIADMSGNVWEWCSDWYGASYYASTGKTNPRGPITGTNKVCRGGSWKGLAEFTSVTYRNHRSPTYRSPDLGFRIAKDQLNSIES